MAKRFDLLVVGGGPAGYTSAIRGAQKGLKTMLVDHDLLGGTCLNRGCIPAKTLLEDSMLIAAARRCIFMRGDMEVSLKRINEKKKALIETSRAGIISVLKENGVEILRGKAAFVNPTTVKVAEPDAEQEIEARHIIVATGARADLGTGLKADGRSIWRTEHALEPERVPPSLAVVGAGTRGVEFAVMYHNFGTRVVLIEKQGRILPGFDAELADRYRQSLVNRKIRVLTRTTVVSAVPGDEGRVCLGLEGPRGREELDVEKVLLTGTRKPSYEGLNLDAACLGLVDEKIPFGPGGETLVKGIYVVGDASGPPYLAHKAIAQAIRAVDHMVGEYSDLRAPVYPSCVYGEPELAAVGLTEEQALQSGHKVRIGEFRFIGNGRAGSMGREEGAVMIVSDAHSGEVLGVHMIGPQVTELISLATLAMQNGIDVAGIKKTVFPHPCLSEAFFEAALATGGEAIHMKIEKE